jgi:DNA-binding LacI/PurR family transcriptional regulator
VLHGVTAEASRLGYRVLIQVVADTAGALDEALEEAAMALPVDGVIVIFQHPQTLGERAPTGLPIVAFDDINEAPYWPSVSTDNDQGGYLATAHMLESGRRQLVAIAPRATAAYINQRLAGFRRALSEAGIDPDEAVVLHADNAYSPVSPYSVELDALITRGVAFDGVFALVDFVAFPALRSLHRAGIDVPRDVSVVGFDDERGAEISDPTLTSVRQPYPLLGARLVQMAIAQIKDGTLPPSLELEPAELIVRDSSRVEAAG